MPPTGTAPVPTVPVGRLAYERYIVGSFQVKIPVSAGEAMLGPEETTLAILKARLAAMPRPTAGTRSSCATSSRSLGGWTVWAVTRTPYRRPWAVISRLLAGPARRTCRSSPAKSVRWYSTASSTSSGFILNDCHEHRAFESREKEIGDLVLRALRERFTLMVVTAENEPGILRLVVKA